MVRRVLPLVPQEGVGDIWGKTRKTHYPGWIDLMEKVGTPFLDPIFSLVSYSGAHKASNGRPGYVMRPDSQMYVTLGGVWAHMAGRRRRMGSKIVGTPKGAHKGQNNPSASHVGL